MEDVKHTRIQGDLVVSFRDGEIYVRQFINNTVVLTFHKESDRVKFDLRTNVFFKETFHPFTLDSREMPEMTEKPETALVAARVERKCLPSCSIQ